MHSVQSASILPQMHSYIKSAILCIIVIFLIHILLYTVYILFLFFIILVWARENDSIEHNSGEKFFFLWFYQTATNLPTKFQQVQYQTKSAIALMFLFLLKSSFSIDIYLQVLLKFRRWNRPLQLQTVRKYQGPVFYYFFCIKVM